jgi:CheY-like chemotaxis protein
MSFPDPVRSPGAPARPSIPAPRNPFASVPPLAGAAGEERPSPRVRRPKVLLVDDDDSLALLMHRILYQDNDRYDVLLAKNVETALAILTDVAVDVIVTDIQLPDRSGMDLLSWAAMERPETRVIVMTGFDVHSIRHRAHALGCLRLLGKPIQSEELRSTVLQALERRDGFAGTLSELSCVDVLQMLCLARKTTAIRFSDDTSAWAVYVERGEIVHAVWNDMVGEDAFYGLLAAEKGVFHTAPFPADVERTIDSSWQHLFIEGTRRMDEAMRDKSASVPPKAG